MIQLLNLRQRQLMAYRLALVGFPSPGLYFYPDIFMMVPLALLPAIPGALLSRWRENQIINGQAQAAIDWYDGVVWIWRGPRTGRRRSEAACSRRGRSDARGMSPANADAGATSDSRSPYVSAPLRVKEEEERRRKEQERQAQQNGPTM